MWGGGPKKTKIEEARELLASTILTHVPVGSTCAAENWGPHGSVCQRTLGAGSRYLISSNVRKKRESKKRLDCPMEITFCYQ